MTLEQNMHRFVREHGGRVRFDAFTREHLMGQTGFFSSHIDMTQSPMAVYTPSQKKAYVESLARSMVEIIHESFGWRGSGRPLHFVEIGGGAAQFKSAFLRAYQDYRRAGGPLRLSYTSVEPNPHNRKRQKLADAQVVEGTAQHTGLAASSADILFDDEVLDTLPFRVFHFHPSNGVTREAFVHLRPEREQPLEIHYNLAETDQHTQAVERHLRGKRERYYNYSPDYAAYWSESNRVLGPGGVRVSLDYPDALTRRFVPKVDSTNTEALRKPYRVDLTHGIDFSMQQKIAEAHGFHNAAVFPLVALFGSHLTEENHLEAVTRQVIVAQKPG